MGDPRRLKKKYSVPRRIWDSDRIKEERKLVEDYGLKNIKEVWIAKEKLRKIRRESRKLLGTTGSAEEELKGLLSRVKRMGFTEEGASLDDLLALTPKSILERRLQTIVYKHGLARSLRQARQLITHGFISIGGKKVSTPSYLLPVDKEEKISYYKPFKIVEPVTKEQKIVEHREERLKKTVTEVGEVDDVKEVQELKEVKEMKEGVTKAESSSSLTLKKTGELLHR